MMIMYPSWKPLIITVIAIAAALAVVVTSTLVTPPAFAIKRFYNCMTDIANGHGKLTINDVNTCYDKEYNSHQGLFLLTHGNLAGGGSTSGDSGNGTTSSSSK
jgi:hypothetical protein